MTPRGPAYAALQPDGSAREIIGDKNLSRWLSIPTWSAISLAGAFALAAVAWSRGEPVNALWLVIASVAVFAISCRFHSAWLMAKVLTLDELRATPAVALEDRKDIGKTNRLVVFGHHFAAIAGPGPLVGPVLAAQFGFLPGLLWISIGATLGRAVHDSLILFCSVRRGGKSLGQTPRGHVATFDKAGEFTWREGNSHKTVAVALFLFIRCGLCDEAIAVDGASTCYRPRDVDGRPVGLRQEM